MSAQVGIHRAETHLPELLALVRMEFFPSAANGWERAIKALENLPILTADPQIARYPVEIIW